MLLKIGYTPPPKPPPPPKKKTATNTAKNATKTAAIAAAAPGTTPASADVTGKEFANLNDETGNLFTSYGATAFSFN